MSSSIKAMADEIQSNVVMQDEDDECRCNEKVVVGILGGIIVRHDNVRIMGGLLLLLFLASSKKESKPCFWKSSKQDMTDDGDFVVVVVVVMQESLVL
jgi:hypothetical protein